MTEKASKPFRCARDARPGWVKALDLVRGFMLSRGVQLGAQLATGQVIMTLFVVVPALTFPLSCLAAIFYIAAELLVAQDQHCGSHLIAGAVSAGHLILGSVFAALVIMLAHAPGVAYTTFLCVFSVFAWIPVAALRAKMGPLALLVNLGFAFTILNSQFHWPLGKLWTGAILPAIYTALIAALGVIVSGLVTLPTLARDEMREILAATLREIGSSVSGYASHMLVPHHALQQDEVRVAFSRQSGVAVGLPVAAADGTDHAADGSPMGDGGHASHRIIAVFEQPVLADFQAALRVATDPASQERPVRVESHGFSSVAQLLPALETVKRLLSEAQCEPPQLSISRMLLPPWTPVVSAVETLVHRVGALECVLDGREPLLDAARLQHALGYDIMPELRMLYAHVAACANSFATDLQAHQGHAKLVRHGRLFDPAWARLESELAAAFQQAMASYWARHAHIWDEDPLNPPHLQVRAIMFVITLTNDIMAAIADVEGTLEAAAAAQCSEWPSRKLRQDARAAQAAEKSSRHDVEAPTAPGGASATDSTNSQQASPARLHRGSDVGHQLDDANGLSSVPGSPTSGRLRSVYSIEARESSSTTAGAGTENGAAPALVRPFQRLSFDTGGLKPRRKVAPTGMDQGGSQQAAGSNSSGGNSSAASGKGAMQERGPKQQPSKARQYLKNEVAWLWVLMEQFLCAQIIQALIEMWKEARVVFRSRTALLRQLKCGRKWQYFVKYYLLCSTCTAVIFVLSHDVPSIPSWNPLYVLFTAIVVLSEKVETTAMKALFRAIGTVIGGTLGYLAMLRSPSATNPYGLTVILCAWVFIGSFLALKTEIRYAVFLTLITTEAVILCQYGLEEGTVKYFYARVADVAIGLVIVLIVDILVLPWYSSSAVLEDLGAGLKDACTMLREFQDVFVHALQQPGTDGKGEQHTTEEPALAGKTRQALQARLGARLAGVQRVLAREQVLWTRGALAMPQVANMLKDALSAVLLRMTAVESVLQAKPIITGRFTDTPLTAIVMPIQSACTAALDANIELGTAVDVLLSGDDRGHVPEQLDAVDAALAALEAARLELRRAYLDQMQEYHAQIRAGAYLDRTADDAVRWASWAFATSAAIDKVMLLANVARRDPWLVQRCHRRRLWWRYWLPLPASSKLSGSVASGNGKPSGSKPSGGKISGSKYDKQVGRHGQQVQQKQQLGQERQRADNV